MGADPTLDYWACLAAAKIVQALPGLGWKDASAVLPGQMAAPGLIITAAVCPGAHFDWTAPAFQPVLLLSELLVGFTPASVSRFADGLARPSTPWPVAYRRWLCKCMSVSMIMSDDDDEKGRKDRDVATARSRPALRGTTPGALRYYRTP